MVALRSGWIAVVLAVLFLVPAAPTAGPASPAVPESPSGESIVRIHVAPSEVATLGAGVEVMESYDTFVLARATAEAVARLSQRTTVVAEDTYTLHVNGYGFDVRGGVQVPPALAAADHVSGTAYYIVQFVGPVKEDWRLRLESLGPAIVGYVPNNAFVVRATVADIRAAEGLREVQWIGSYHPAFRIAPELVTAEGTVTVKVITFGEERVGGVVASLAKMGFRVVGRFSPDIGILTWGTYSDFGLVRIRLDASYLVPIARLGAVRYIEPQEEMQLFNQQEQYVLQTNATSEGAGVRRIWDNGLRGDLQTIGLADTGLDYDHTMFRHDQNVVTTGDIYNTTVTTRRKVIRYLTMSQYVGVDPWGTDPGPRKDSPDGFCGSGHGTATSAAAAGFDSTFAPASLNDGMAPNAKLVMMDIGRVDATGCDDVLGYIPDDYADLFGPAYAAPTNARIFSNSWGGTSSAYTTEARMVDTFVWNNPDAVIMFANGNNPPNALVGSPATNKNGVSVSGASSIGNREALGAASVGPTTDGRRKPDITTIYATTSPGGSAISDGDLGTLNAGDGWFGGTSYATPLAAGMAALARQYFMTGWYPRGVASGGFNLLPSAALLKAVLAAGSVQMTGTGSCPGGDAFYPNRNQGWGRLWLDESLHFAGDPKKLFVVDHPTGLFTGDTVEYKVRVASGTALRVMLAYSDYPALEGASPALINNLDLEVIDPSGTSYKGNVRGPCSQGQSATGGAFDTLNNLEGVIRRLPAAGDWRIRIIGANVPYAAQRFGLVVLADLDRTYGVVEVDKTHYSHADTITIKVTDSDASAVSVVVATPTEPTGETIALTQVGAASTVWRATIPTNYAVPTSGNGRIEVSHLDTITVTYNDGSPPHASVATARAELDSPAVYDVRVTGITNAGATITWRTDKPSDSVVYYGTTPALGTTVSNPVMVTTHSLTITGLTTETLYYYDVGSSYVGGLATRDANGGAHYRFKTVEKAEILLVLSDLGSLTQERLEMYRNALASASWAWNEWDIGRQGDPPLATLQTYKVILWQAGLEQYPPMADAHATLLKSYVDSGGRIFFSGHDFAWAACDTAGPSPYMTTARCNFVRGVMKAGYVADPSTFSLESGVAADPISGAYTSGVAYVPHRSGGAGDEVNALAAGGTTTTVWRTNSGGAPPWDGLKWESSGPNGTLGVGVWGGTPSRVVSYLYEFTGINFVSGVYANPQRTDILNKTVVYLLGRAPPVIRVTSPNGGETITTNTLNMAWQRSAGLASQEIWHSDDGGASWTQDKIVAGGANSDAMDISAWPNGDRYLVRIVGYDSGTPQFKGQDASDATFRVNRPGGDVLGPLVRPGSLRLFPNPARNSVLVRFNATVDDTLRGLGNVNAAEYFVQDTEPTLGQYGAGSSMSAVDGAFSGPLEDVTAAEVAPWPGGSFQTVWVHAIDTASPTPNWGPFSNRTFLVINGTSGVPPNPPTGFTASLAGGSFADVRLTWAYTGPAVDKFQVYFGSAYDATRSSYALLQDNIASTATSWDHVGAGSGNANNYFYYVRAVNTGGSADSADQAAKFTRPVTAGMQLVSIPLVLQDPRVTTTLQTLSFRTARTYVASDGADEWKAWYQAKGNGDLLSVSLGMALWVDVVGPDDFTIAGRVPASTTLTLVGGTWNFVGYGSFIVRAANVAFPGGLGVTQLEIYAPVPQYYLQRAPLTTSLEPGRGYWVYATTGGAWTVNN